MLILESPLETHPGDIDAGKSNTLGSLFYHKDTVPTGTVLEFSL